MKSMTSFLIIAIFLSCSTDPVSPLLPQDAAKKLTITLDHTEYSWSSNNIISVSGTLTNNTEHQFYSNIGDDRINSMNQEVFHFTRSTTGFVEKFNTETLEWEDFDTHFTFGGGSLAIVQIQPFREYDHITILSSTPVHEVTGTFRLRVHYYDEIDPLPQAIPHIDYSEVFKVNK